MINLQFFSFFFLVKVSQFYDETCIVKYMRAYIFSYSRASFNTNISSVRKDLIFSKIDTYNPVHFWTILEQM